MGTVTVSLSTREIMPGAIFRPIEFHSSTGTSEVRCKTTTGGSRKRETKSIVRSAASL